MMIDAASKSKNETIPTPHHKWRMWCMGAWGMGERRCRMSYLQCTYLQYYDLKTSSVLCLPVVYIIQPCMHTSMCI